MSHDTLPQDAPAGDAASAHPRRQLSLFDSTSIIIGIVVGSGIYKATPLIANSVTGSGQLIAAWVAGGVIALLGALCYAELTTTYPLDGGDYVYLSRAYGRQVGFIYSWAQLLVIRPGSIGAMAFIFAVYAQALLPLGSQATGVVIYAASSVALATVLNVLGIQFGKWTQNVLTLAKVLGLLSIVGLAFLSPSVDTEIAAAKPQFDLGFALVIIMFTYGGWNDMSFVAAEVRHPERNLTRALMLGTFSIAIIYVLVNLAYLRLLGFEAVRNSSAVAADAMAARLGSAGVRLISVLVCISCLGAINGMVLTGARIYYAAGVDHSVLRWLGAWNARLGTPVRSLLLQGAITFTVVVLVGLKSGEAGFDRLVYFTAPLFWLATLLVTLSVFVLRRRDPRAPRPFRVPFFPLPPVIFAAAVLFMCYSSAAFAFTNRGSDAAWMLAVLVSGIVLSAKR